MNGSAMKILCVLDSPVRAPDRWLWDYLPNHQDEVDFVWVTSADHFARWGKLLAYYPAHMMLGLKALWRYQQQQYDLIVAWEGKNGFPLALLRALFGQNDPPLVILTFSVRGLVTRFPRLMRYAVRGVNHLTVPTRREQAYYTEFLNISTDRITFCPLGVYDLFADLPPCPMQDYIFTGGRSGRDYATLFAAIRETSIPVVLNARSFNLKGLVVPPNVTCNDILPTVQFRELLRRARFVVVPLHDVPEAVGLSVILYAMAAGKAIVASRVGGVADYICDGDTGLLVSPGNSRELCEAIEYLWQHPEVATRLGANARQAYIEHYTFTAFAQRIHHILTQVARSATSDEFL